MIYYPEKFYEPTNASYENLEKIKNEDGIVTGFATQWDFEKRALIIHLGNDFIGIIPENELTLEPLKYVQDIPVQAKAKFSKKICAKITHIDGNIVYLSRKSLQCDALTSLKNGNTYKVVITNIVPFGVYVDVACGITAFIHSSELCATRRRSISELHMHTGDEINAMIIKTVPRICMSYRRCMKSPLLFKGDTVKGIVRTPVNSTGYFVELSPNDVGILDVKPSEKIPYGTKISCKITKFVILSDEFGEPKIHYKLKKSN